MNCINENIPELVCDLNRSFFIEEEEFEYMTPFKYISNGDSWVVKFFGYIIANSEDDDRKIVDEDCESWKTYIERNIDNITSNIINRIKEYENNLYKETVYNRH